MTADDLRAAVSAGGDETAEERRERLRRSLRTRLRNHEHGRRVGAAERGLQRTAAQLGVDGADPGLAQAIRAAKRGDPKLLSRLLGARVRTAESTPTLAGTSAERPAPLAEGQQRPRLLAPAYE